MLLGPPYPQGVMLSKPFPHAQVVSTSGDTHLGGEDFDHRVMEYFMKLVKRKYKVGLTSA